jgi:hypothetical protein
MSREDILAEIYSILNAENTLKKVRRDPIIPTELAKTAFPAVYIETANETIEEEAIGLMLSHMEVNIVIYVSGVNRDTKRNNIATTVESKLMLDRTLGGNAKNITLSRIETINPGEATPFASYRLIFDVEYCYTL